MKKQKGFTLIELLAIIVILAIIAVITVPIIQNTIDKSKRKSAEESAHGFIRAIDKHYMTSSMEKQTIKMNGLYIVNNGIINGPTLENTEISITGTKPSSGYLIYDDDNLQSGCLIINGYEAKYNDKEFISSGKGECNINGDFENDSWTTIKTNLTIDRHSYDDQIGKEKEIIIDDTSHTVRLANTSPCPSNWPEEASQTACGVVIEFVDRIITEETKNYGYLMSSADTNIGGWPESTMRSYINETIFNKLPEELKNEGMILDTKIVSGHGSTPEETNFTSIDKLYLLSFVEIWGYNYGEDTVKLVSDTDKDGTKQLDYYKKYVQYNSSNIAGDATAAIKDFKTWWLRSAYSHDAKGYLAINANGSLIVTRSAYSEHITPAFRIMD